MKFVFLVYSISLLVVSKAFECPYSQRYGENSHGSHHLEMELKKEPCPHRVPSIASDINHSKCPHGFKKTRAGDKCPWSFKEVYVKGATCPYGYTDTSTESGCPYNFQKSHGGCPLGLKRQKVNGSKCPYGYKTENIGDGKCPAGFPGVSSGKGCPIGFNKQHKVSGSKCPFGYTRQDAIVTGCPHGFQKGERGCPVGIKKGLVDGSKCPYGGTRKAAFDGKCPRGFVSTGSGKGCPLGFEKHLVAGTKCPYGFNEAAASVQGCPHGFKKSESACPYGFDKSSCTPSSNGCPYGYSRPAGSNRRKLGGCPYGYPKSGFNDGVCPHGFNTTGTGEPCPFGFKQFHSLRTNCPFGYSWASSNACPLNLKGDGGCPYGIKKGLVEGSKCPYGYTREAATDGKCPHGFHGPLSGNGCPLGLRKHKVRGTKCPYGITKAVATAPGCSYGFQKNVGGCPFGPKRGYVEGSKCPFGYTVRQATDGKCPLGFMSTGSGKGCPFGLRRQIVAGSNCPYGFTQNDGLARGCPHGFKKPIDGRGCPFGIQKPSLSNEPEFPYLKWDLSLNERPAVSPYKALSATRYRKSKNSRVAGNDLIKTTWKMAQQVDSIPIKSFLLYFKLKPSAQKRIPELADIDLADLAGHPRLIQLSKTCISGLTAYIDSFDDPTQPPTVRHVDYLKSLRPDDLKLFNKVLYNIMEEELGDSFTYQARQAWKNGLIACDKSFRASSR